VTYSIVARDPDTGQLGVAVQSRYFSVGSGVLWAEAGVGAVATQAMANPDYGPQGVSLMRAGVPAPSALPALVEADEGRDLRQVGMVDAQGRAVAHTGARCIEAAGHIVGEGFSVQANLMVDDTVVPAMRDAYLSAKGDLADRMLASLDAAQAAGGDIRGQQSAAMLVVEGKRRTRPWRGILCELRVEDHARPLEELRRLLKMHRAYRFSDEGDEATAAGRNDEATALYERAFSLVPDHDELQFWAGIGLFRRGQDAEGTEMLSKCFAQNPAMARVVPRLVPLGLVRAEDVDRMVKIAKR
jgi:uncharacterized Ntn-hydrolase superfamily protein